MSAAVKLSDLLLRSFCLDKPAQDPAQRSSSRHRRSHRHGQKQQKQKQKHGTGFSPTLLEGREATVATSSLDLLRPPTADQLGGCESSVSTRRKPRLPFAATPFAATGESGAVLSQTRLRSHRKALPTALPSLSTMMTPSRRRGGSANSSNSHHSEASSIDTTYAMIYDRSNMRNELSGSLFMIRRCKERAEALRRQNAALRPGVELCNAYVCSGIEARGGNPVVTGDGQTWGVYWRTLEEFRAAQLPSSNRTFYMKHKS